MAKKWKKKLEDESSSFKYPKFDEKEYIQKELKETRILFITVLWAIIFAFISLASMIFITRDFLVGLTVGVIGIISLRYIYKTVKIDITILDAKKWIMSSLSFFALWLAVWILICNPPISDFTPPTVEKVKTNLSDKYITPGQDDFVVNIGSNTSWKAISISASITDNSRLNTASIVFGISPRGQGQETPKVLNTSKLDSNTWQWDLNRIYSGMQYDLSISAKDISGNKKVFSFTLDVKI